MDNYNQNSAPNGGSETNNTNNSNTNGYNNNPYNNPNGFNGANNTNNANNNYNYNNNANGYNNNPYNNPNGFNGANNTNNANNNYNYNNNANGYNNNPYNNPYNNMPNNGYQNNPSSNSFGLWIALSIGCFFLFSRLFGVLSLVFTIMSNNAYKVGNYPEYESKLKLTKIMLIIGVVFGVILFILRFGFNFLTYII